MAVPYQGSPTIGPTAEATPYRSDAAPTGAFGAGVAAATQHLGTVVEGVGDELFKRAYAMQELHEQATANEAVSKYTTDMGQKFADYTSLEGKNAVDGYKPFLDGMADSRDQMRQGLTSPYAQRLYDQETRSEAARLTFSAARHAGEQNKAYVIGSAKASAASAIDAVMQRPDDDATYQAGLSKGIDTANHLADISGASPEQREQMVKSAKSDAVSARVQGLAKQQPLVAKKILDDAAKSGDLDGQTAARLGDFVQKQMYNTGARNSASSVMAGDDVHFGAGIVDPTKAQNAIGQIESSGNYNASVVPPKKQDDLALGKYQILRSNLASWLKEAGMANMTAQEFLQNHAAQDQLFTYKFSQFQKEGGSYNAAANMWFTGSYNPSKGTGDGNTTAPEYLRKANAQLANGASLKDLTDAGRSRAEEEAPGDHIYSDYVTSHIETLHNDSEKIRRDQEYDNKQTIEAALVEGTQDGKIPTTIQDLDPKTKAAFDALPSSDQRRYLKVLANNAKGDVAMTEPRLSRLSDLRGMAITDPDKFMDQDILKEDLPLSSKNELLKLRDKVYKKADASPATSHALGVLSNDLENAGIKKSDTQFAGALHDTIQVFQAENKRPPNDDEILTIGRRLLRHSNPGWIFSGPADYQAEPDDKFTELATNTYKAQGIEATPEMIQRLYVQMQYRNLYAKKTAAKPAAAQPKVPISE